jgi:hypothetical protein
MKGIIVYSGAMDQHEENVVTRRGESKVTSETSSNL